jgi:deoxyribodipyrimidine photolyase-related protein
MSRHSRTLFHTRMSALLNVGRLSARRVVDEAAALDIPLESKEGFIRQILGWREFVRHVHEATDGFRVIHGAVQPTLGHTGDGGMGRWRGQPWPKSASSDGGSRASGLGAQEPLPPAFWGVPSGLRCLDEVVRSVWDEGYSHHITRLMVLSNIASLLDVSPRELTDWFWVAYIDAYDWVVEPNVLAMGTFGVGDLMTTKPYIAGSGYISKMSDYCSGCRFDPKKTCPLPSLYWAYLGRHTEVLSQIDRMKLPVRAEAQRSPEQKTKDRSVFEHVSNALQNGQELHPETE